MLGDLTEREFRRIIEDSCGNPVIPWAHDPAARERARRLADQTGLLAKAESELTPDEPFRVIPRSAFREFQRTGGRSQYDGIHGKRIRQIDHAVMLCLFGADHVDYLQDLLWAECELTWWISPAHEYVEPIDLRSAMSAEHYATVLDLLGERLEDEVASRLRDEIYARVLDPFCDPNYRHLWWRRNSNNWNAVCHGGICIAAMMLERDPARLGRIVTTAVKDLAVFIDGFADDGGCTEGPSYWRYGFGWYTRLAHALHDFTDGRIDIMRGEKIERVCRYPLAVNVRPGKELTFADAHEGYQSLATTIRINRFHDVRELFGLCRLSDDGDEESGWRPVLSNLDELLLYDGARYRPLKDPTDYVLPELGVAKLKARGTTVGAKAGHNDEHHNHNDVGSFIVQRGESCFVCDPGGPIYTARTFSDRRYESAFTNSFGHSVPTIDGQPQAPGREFAGTLTTRNVNEDGYPTALIEMAGAYDLPMLQRLTREIRLSSDGGSVGIRDAFEFSEAPESLVDAFITTFPAEASADGQSVMIRSEADGDAVLRADGSDGTFAVRELTEESKESPKGQLLRRIEFTPAGLAENVTLSFELTLPTG